MSYQEVRAEQRRQMEEIAKIPGPEGAWARLILKLDPNDLSVWLAQETQNGDPQKAIQSMQMVGYLLGLMAALAAGSMPHLPSLAGMIITETFRNTLASAISGDLKLEAMVFDPDTKREDIATLAGILQGKSPIKPGTR